LGKTQTSIVQSTGTGRYSFCRKNGNLRSMHRRQARCHGSNPDGNTAEYSHMQYQQKESSFWPYFPILHEWEYGELKRVRREDTLLKNKTRIFMPSINSRRAATLRIKRGGKSPAEKNIFCGNPSFIREQHRTTAGPQQTAHLTLPTHPSVYILQPKASNGNRLDCRRVVCERAPPVRQLHAADFYLVCC
jgi:hypothetical protein